MRKKTYLSIVDHYESCYDKHGDTNLGVDWPNLEDAHKRYQVMLEVASFNKFKTVEKKATLLDFGCGTGHLLDYLINNNITSYKYSGLDISEKFITRCKQKFNDIPFFLIDILKQPQMINNYDYIIMNGVFTEKRELSFEEMYTYFVEMVKIIFEKCNKAIAFNLMSKQVDWEREDLFHMPLDVLANFLTKEITRDYIIRNDYGLYEYTVYLYK